MVSLSCREGCLFLRQRVQITREGNFLDKGYLLLFGGGFKLGSTVFKAWGRDVLCFIAVYALDVALHFGGDCT